MDEETTKAIIFVDGFGGLAVMDVSETHKDIIQYMNDESPWEVFDGLQSNPRGKYIVKFNFWWESNFPDQGDELVIDHENIVTEAA